MLLKVIKFKRSKKSEFEKGILLETQNYKNVKIFDKEGNEPKAIHSYENTATSIDLLAFLNQ